MVLIRQLILSPDFNNRLKCVNDKVKDNFRFWQAHSPHYTDHGEFHCEALERNLDEFIPSNVKASFNEYESFLLLCGVLLHDIGIMYACSTTEENEKIRANHNERSRNYVLNHLEDLLNGSERYIIGEICYAHRDSVAIKKIEKTKIIRHPSLGNQIVRVQFLAALVRVADTFDLCHTRTAENLNDLIKFQPEAAFFHALHERLSGIDFDEEAQSIFLDFNISSAVEKKICLKYVVHDAQRALDSVRDCLISNNIIYTTVFPVFSN